MAEAAAAEHIVILAERFGIFVPLIPIAQRNGGPVLGIGEKSSFL